MDDGKPGRYVDKLLTKYVDTLNSGERPNKEAFIKECPEIHRAELKDLLEMIDVFKRNSLSPNALERQMSPIFKLIKSLAEEFQMKSRNTPAAMAVSFRKGPLNKDEERIVSDEIARIVHEVDEEE